jgi:pimeloyl-ACP methyl ester carboxylesterase
VSVRREPERCTRVGALELCHESFGEPGDPPVLLIMGVGSQMIQWPDGFCELLALRGHRVIRFDNRDCGRSTKLTEPPPALGPLMRGEPAEIPYGLHEMAADGAGLLEALGIDRAHIVGASLGGMIAQRLVLDFPERALSLASIMSTPGDRRVGKATPEALEVLMRPPARERDSYIERVIAARRVIGSIESMRDEEITRDIAGRAFDRGIFNDGTARQFAAIFSAVDRTAELGSITVPTVVIHGDEDSLIGVDGGEATAAAIPGAELLVIEGMGHDFPPAAWERITAALTANFERAEVPA